MSDDFWKPKGGAKLETWGAFLEYVSEHGVLLKTDQDFTSPDGRTVSLQYLYREDQGQHRTYPLPEECPPTRRLGYSRMLAACIALNIPVPKWPIAF